MEIVKQGSVLLCQGSNLGIQGFDAASDLSSGSSADNRIPGQSFLDVSGRKLIADLHQSRDGNQVRRAKTVELAEKIRAGLCQTARRFKRGEICRVNRIWNGHQQQARTTA